MGVGDKAGKRKAYMLSYADDVVLLEEEEDEKYDGEVREIFRWKAVKTKCEEDENNEIQEKRREG